MIAAMPPLFAANIELVITIVIILISFVGWVVNLVNEKARDQQQRRAAPRNQPGGKKREFQDEIDDFLEQVGGKRPKPKPQPQDDFEIEIVPDEEIYDREQQERRSHSISSLEDHHVESSHLGERISAAVAADLDSNPISSNVVDSEIDEDLVVEYGEVKTDRQPVAAKPGGILGPEEIIQAIRDPAGIRKAIVINEVLTRRRPRR